MRLKCFTKLVCRVGAEIESQICYSINIKLLSIDLLCMDTFIL